MARPEHDEHEQAELRARDRKAWNIPAPRAGTGGSLDSEPDEASDEVEDEGLAEDEEVEDEELAPAA